jgi:hypothetical protein
LNGCGSGRLDARLRGLSLGAALFLRGAHAG